MNSNHGGNKLINRGSVYRNLLFLLIVFFVVSLYFVSREVFVGFAQKSDQKIKEVTWSKWGNEPIDIELIRNTSTTIRFDEKFEQESDWLNGFSVTIKNKSDKNIKFIRLSLDFLETAKTGNMMTFPMSFGKNPADKRSETKSSLLGSGETVTLALSDKQHKQLKAFLESRHAIDELKKLQIVVIKVLYEDDTGWNLGNQIRMEPGNPRPVIVKNPTESGAQ